MEKLNSEEILCLIENIGDVAIALGNRYIDVEVKNQKYNGFLTQLDIPDAKYIAEKYIRSVATTFDYKNDLKYTFKFDEITISSKILYKNESWYSHKIGLNETEMDPIEIPFDANQLAKLVELIDKGTISSSIGKKVLVELFENPRDPEDIIKEKGWIQISDEGAIKEVVTKIIEANPQSVADYKAGKERALGFLVGQAMKETKGKANPQMLNKMFAEELKK